MCGLAGILAIAERDRNGSTLIPEAWLDALESSIAHRGPDARGRFRDQATSADRLVDVALVHRRLSILDHQGGAQPMVSGLASTGAARARLLQGRPGAHADYDAQSGHDLLAVVFNGCIYNHRELRRDLEAAGHVFESDHSDTEVLLHGVREHGVGLANRLDGMYAYAIWSAERGSLTLARDPAGEKPLYLTRWIDDGIEFVAFSSVPATLLELRRLAGCTNEPDPLGVALWLKHGYWDTMPVADMIECAPGTTIEIDGSSAWPPIPAARIDARDAAGASATDDDAWLAMLAHAVESRLEADVPIGCFLSGGVDSSIVAALAQRAMASQGRTLRTFNVRMPDAKMDESVYAMQVAEHLGTDHEVLSCQASAAEDLVRLIEQLGLPFGDSSLLPTTWVSEAARAHVTVVLGGDGGDELFAGYDRYRVNSLFHQLRVPLSWLKRAPSWMPGIKLGGTLGRVTAAARHAGYDDILSTLRTPLMITLLGRTTASELLGRAYARRESCADARQDDFDRYLPMDLMRKVDTASMSVALEVRAPFLQRELVGVALSTPLKTIYAGEGRKGLLRRVARSLAPSEAIDRKKAGFGVPIGRWFREDFAGMQQLLRDTLERPDAFDGVGIEIRRQGVRELMDEHFNGRRDHGKRLYALLVLALWAQLL